MAEPADVLVDHHVLEFPGGYKRSVGPVVSRFLTAVRDEQRLLGVRTPDGRVVCPPVEYDPATSAELGGHDDDWVDVGPGGEVVTWTWVAEPRPEHPLDHPFAFALVRLDGADTAMLHAVDVGAHDVMRTGLRVTAHFRSERAGHVTDFHFVPEAQP